MERTRSLPTGLLGSSILFEKQIIINYGKSWSFKEDIQIGFGVYVINLEKKNTSRVVSTPKLVENKETRRDVKEGDTMKEGY